MANKNPQTTQQATNDLNHSIIQLALVAIIAMLSYRIFSPFEGMMFWG
ncbi:MAG: hypothetical protein ABW068_14715 [Candidatus Thiodiazotropha sp.]